MIKIVFIDIDNTLLDFNECARSAMRQSFLEAGLNYTEEMFPVFLATNNELWRALERGELTKTRLREIRWNTIFKKLNIDYDGVRLERRFERLLETSHAHVEGAEDALKYLAERYDVYAVTNGFASTQKNRMAAAGLDKYVKAEFVSEEIGFDKPSARYFDVCFDRIGNPPKSEVILIGDSLTADIAGGVSYGLITCWYNHNGEPIPEALKPDYIIDSISDVKHLF